SRFISLAISWSSDRLAVIPLKQLTNIKKTCKKPIKQSSSYRLFYISLILKMRGVFTTLLPLSFVKLLHTLHFHSLNNVALSKWLQWKLSFLLDRKSTRLNSSHVSISYAVLCLKNKNI